MHTNKFNKAFTLIELLVVVAIIGILASVVLASLTSARDQGKQTAIKSGLKNIISQAELSYGNAAPNSYINVCTDAAKILTGIGAQGTTTSCYSHNASAQQDVYLRWGATAIKYSATPPVKAWSSSSALGVVTWDAQGVNSSGVFVGTDVTMDWATANTACATAGGRLPTVEEIKTLTDATFIATGNVNPIPPGFVASIYWSNITVPSNNSNAYYVPVNGASIANQSKASGGYVRCVR